MKKAIAAIILTLTAGLSKACGARSGGVRKIWLANVNEILSFTLTGNSWSAVTMDGSAKFFLFEFEQDTAYHKGAGTTENMAIKVDHEVGAFFSLNNAIKRDRFQEILEASPCGVVAIVEDNNGTKWVRGWSNKFAGERALKNNTVDDDSGKLMTDLSGTTIVLKGTDSELARVFTGTVPV